MAEGTRLESVRGATHRGFESRSLRQPSLFELRPARPVLVVVRGETHRGLKIPLLPAICTYAILCVIVFVLQNFVYNQWELKISFYKMLYVI